MESLRLKKNLEKRLGSCKQISGFWEIFCEGNVGLVEKGAPQHVLEKIGSRPSSRQIHSHRLRTATWPGSLEEVKTGRKDWILKQP